MTKHFQKVTADGVPDERMVADGCDERKCIGW